jgi:8-oxo-dGTP diphosphatase
VVLVNSEGWLLMQERDASAPRSPNKWGLVGGHLEANEDFEAAAYRELEEETGVAWSSGLIRWFDGEFLHSGEDLPTRAQVWVAPTDLTDRNIVLGEGRQIVFVDPARIDGLDMGEMAGHLVRALLQSATYAALVAGAASMAEGQAARPTAERPADGPFDTPSGSR